MHVRQTATVGATQRLRIGLAPAVRSSLAVLRMPAGDLGAEIAREAAENPFLIVARPSGGIPADAAGRVVAPQDSLPMALARQIGLQRLDPDTARAALIVAGELREDGYLDTPLADIAAETGLPLPQLRAGLHAVQQCEPAGVGARDLAEFAALWLADAGLPVGVAQSAAQRMDDFAQGRWARLTRELGLPRARLEAIAALMRRLGPAPIDPAAALPPPPALVPEIAVEIDARGRLGARTVAEALPRLRVADRGAATDSPTLEPLVRRADRLVADVTRRSDTLLRIVRRIVADQDGFFLQEPPVMAPVTQAESALALAMHPSTFSRAIHGKALSWRGRTLPLAMFFTRALPAPGGSLSSFDIRCRIRAAIQTEDKSAPLADDAICAHLRKEGVDIARRTVAKYRKCMRIPSVYGRRRRKGTS